MIASSVSISIIKHKISVDPHDVKAAHRLNNYLKFLIFDFDPQVY